MPIPIWNPELVFNIINPDPGYLRQTCVGYAPTQKRRCRNPIAAGNRDKAQRILRNLETMYPSIDDMEEDLMDLASICLCVRYHRSQASTVVKTWCHTIRNEQERLARTRRSNIAPPVDVARGMITPARTRLLTASSDSGYSSSSSTPSSSPPSTRGSSPPSSSSSRRASSSSSVPSFGSLFDRLETVSTTTLSLSSSSSSFRSNSAITTSFTRRPPPSSPASDSGRVFRTSSNYTPSTISSSARAIVGPISQTPPNSSVEPIPSTSNSIVVRTTSTSTTRASSSNSTASLAPGTRTPSTNPSSSERSSSTDLIHIPSTSSSTTTPSQPERAHCTAHHVNRRTTDTECPVCTSLMTTTPITALVWCKSQCGQSFHKDCFDLWSRHGNTCICCRTSWPEACEHDTKTAPAFSIWTEEEMGLVRLFDLRWHLLDAMEIWL